MEIKKIGVLIAVFVLVAGLAYVKMGTKTMEKEDKKILTVEYNGKEKSFTLEDLMNLEKTSIKTEDPYLGKEILYEGVSLETFEKELSINCESVKVIGEDGYNKTINSKDFNLGIIVAYKADGEPIKKGDGGPIKLCFSEEAKKVYDEKNWVWWIAMLEFE